MKRVWKQVLSLSLAAVLTVGLLGSSAFAGQVTGINSSAYPFDEAGNKVTEAIADTDSNGDLRVQLGYSAIVTNGSLPQNSSDLAGLQAMFYDPILFTNLFSSYDIEYNPNNQKIEMVLVPKSVSTETPFSLTFVLTHINNITNFTLPGTIKGTIYGDPVTSTGDIIEFAAQSGIPTLHTQSVPATSAIAVELNADMFEFASGTRPSTANRKSIGLQVYEADIKAEIIDANRSGLTSAMDIDFENNTAQVRLTFTTTPSVNTVYSGKVRLYSDRFTRTFIALNYSFTITNAAISNNKITGIDTNAQLGYEQNGIWSRASLNGSTISALDNVTVRPGDIINLEFDSDFFEWENGKPEPAAFVTRSHITNGKITAKRTGSTTNSGVIDSIEMKYDNSRAYVQVKFKTGLTTTKDQDFSFSVGLAYNSTVKSGTEALISGTVERDVVYIYSGDDYIDVSEGEVAEAEESISKIDVYIGEGVTITVRMTKGKQYSGSVSVEPTTSDRTVMDKYPDIELVYNLTTTNLNQSGDIVSFDVGDTYHVYDKDIKYLGTTASKLPYSTKYFLATKQLGVDSDVQGSNDVVEVPTPAGTTPGAVSGNGNFNPATGR